MEELKQGKFEGWAIVEMMGHGKAATCDKPCCAKHCKGVGPDVDYCQDHANAGRPKC